MSTVTPTTTSTKQHETEEDGYHKALRPRQIRMIGIGGAIGTGLFLGAGGRLANAGPALFLVYAVCGMFVFFILRALGELVLHRPATGSFVSYAREFYGEKLAFVSGWMYSFTWSMTSIVDVTAIALYMQFWPAFRTIPQWMIALAALVVVMVMNLVSVRWFGELEFWAALVKVLAITVFLAVGSFYLATGKDIAGHETGLINMFGGGGGFLPHGLLPLVLVVSGVIFAYSAVELVGTAAGETAEPHKVMPKAINSVIVRIALFYVGSLILLALLLPRVAFSAGESPFVTFFDAIGVANAGTIMNLVVVTAALSSLNAGLYSTGRILRSMAVNGSAPALAGRMSKRGVPYVGILMTSVVTLCGVALNAINPGQAFEIVLNMTALGIVVTWATIVLCQIKLHALARQGKLLRPWFRMSGSPWSGYATLVFLAAVLLLTALDYPVGTWTVGSIVIVAPALTVGWYAVRHRVRAHAEAFSTQSSNPAEAGK